MTEQSGQAVAHWGGMSFAPDTRVIDVVNVADEDLAPLARLSDLAVLRVGWTNPHEVPVRFGCDLGPLRSLRQLRTVVLPGFKIEDLEPLAALPLLEEVDVSGSQVSDVSPVAPLPRLRVLILDRCPVSDLEPLTGTASLERLSVRGTDVTEASVERLRTLRPSIDVVT